MVSVWNTHFKHWYEVPSNMLGAFAVAYRRRSYLRAQVQQVLVLHVGVMHKPHACVKRNS